jgi:hypothetical protein
MADVHKVVEQTKMQYAITFADLSCMSQDAPSSRENP